MEFFASFFKVLFPVIAFITGIIKIIDFIEKYKEHKFMKALNATFSNPVGKIFLVSFLITAIICYVEYLNSKTAAPKISNKIIHDTVRIQEKRSIDSNVISPLKPSVKHKNRIFAISAISNKRKITDTLSKAKNLVTASNFGNQQIGDNNTQNNVGRIDHHPETQDVNYIFHYLPNKSRTIVLEYETPDSDSKNYCVELKKILESYGYKIELFGHLVLGENSQPQKITVDTTNYIVSVEWNYN